MLHRAFGYTVLEWMLGQKHCTSALEEGKTSLCDVTCIRQGKKVFERFFSRITLTKYSRANSPQGLYYGTHIFEHGAHAVCVKTQLCSR